MQIVTNNEECTYDDERNSNSGDDSNALPHRVKPVVIQAVNKRRSRQTNEGQQDAASELMFPGNDEHDDQDKRWNHVHQKSSDLLP